MPSVMFFQVSVSCEGVGASMTYEEVSYEGVSYEEISVVRSVSQEVRVNSETM